MENQKESSSELIVQPIICSGDAIGSVALVGKSAGERFGNSEQMLVKQQQDFLDVKWNNKRGLSPLSAFLGNIIDQTFCIFPSQTRIGDRTARSHMVADILAAFEQITFNHDTLDEFSYIRIVVAAVKHFTYNTNLFFVLFAGVRMVDIHDDGRILQIFFAV